ncbi:MAG: Mur ligase family protein [Candidatus Peregrinibacteria bacterium]
MKEILKKFVLFLLKIMARARMRRYKGTVIAVTGSVGKTSTKDAIFTILNSKFKVKRSEKSMNSEFGVMLSVLDIESGYSSLAKWSVLLIKGFYNCFFRDHSDVMLLELGVDKPRDMDFLLSVVKPDISVMTSIAPVHMAEGQFENMDQIFEEKRKMVDALKEGGIAILNTDNPYLSNLARLRGKKGTMTFGKNEDADYRAEEISQSIDGIDFVLRRKDESVEVRSKVLGEHQVYVLIPALVCAEIMGIDMPSAIAAISRFSLPPGRMNVISGMNDAVILDSSYNSSPEALKAALNILKVVGEDRHKVAVLGNMNELGKKSRVLHEMIGEIVPDCADVLLTIGADAKLIAGKAEENGMKKENVHSFKSADEAAEFFKSKIKKNDVILVKGSQNNVRLEIFVKKIMRNPEEAPSLLVRQEKAWQAKGSRNIQKT